MKTASRSFLVLFFAAAFVSSQAFAQARPQRPGHSPGPQMPRERQVQAGALINLRVDHIVRAQAQIDIMRLVRQQTGLTLAGAEIQRVIVQAQTQGRFGRPASVAVLLNGRLEGREKDLDPRQIRTPILLNSFEEVRFSLDLLVRGEARINSISVRVGRVRPLRIR